MRTNIMYTYIKPPNKELRSRIAHRLLNPTFKSAIFQNRSFSTSSARLEQSKSQLDQQLMWNMEQSIDYSIYYRIVYRLFYNRYACNKPKSVVHKDYAVGIPTINYIYIGNVLLVLLLLILQYYYLHSMHQQSILTNTSFPLVSK